MTWVKICGTTSLRDAQLSIAVGADALGFVFAPSSRHIEIATAREIITAIGSEAEAVGVFVNEHLDRVAEVVEQSGLTGVQLHGDEPPGSLPEFRRALGERKIIKTLHARELLSGERKLNDYLAACDSIDAILLDSGSAQQRGGTGATFAWQELVPLAREIRSAMPLIIAGGLTAENVGSAVELFGPWGVDVVSGTESSPGTKDEAKLRRFVGAVRQTQTSARQRE